MSVSPSADSQMHETVRAVIDDWAASAPDALFLINPANGEKTSYRVLQQRVQSVSAHIANWGYKPGDPVAYALSNSPEAAIVILGILYGGYLATAINLVAGNNTISYVLEHSETKLLIANEAGLAALETPLQERSGVSVQIVSPDLFQQLNSSSEEEADALTGGLLMYTSGTTGRPKGVVLSQASLLAGGRNTTLAHELTGEDCGLCVLPLYHINGLCVTVMGTLVSGGSLVIPAKFSVSTFWQKVITQGCTWFSVVPTQISYLLHDSAYVPEQSDLKDVRFGRSASAPLSPDVQSAFESKFGIPIIETMGLTETSAQILSNPLPPGVRKIGSPGVAYGNEVRIGDELQRDLPRGTEGEVLVRGPNVMSHYLKNEQATQDAVTAEGWLRTGDLGRMDEEGYVYITGRLKELIIKGGENIAPREVDEALYTHPDVVEAAAFARKCDRYGETVEAAVMVSEGSALTEVALIEICTAKLGKFKTPERVHFLPELPKGPSGKIQRIKLVEQFRR
ncbi:MAG: AMP-binding protein [Stappiaceae bacterium]